MEISFTVIDILDFAKEEAIRTGNLFVLPEHIILGILRHKTNSIYMFFSEINTNIIEIKTLLEKKITNNVELSLSDINKLDFSTDSMSIIDKSQEISKLGKNDLQKIWSPHHVFIALMLMSKNKNDISYIIDVISEKSSLSKNELEDRFIAFINSNLLKIYKYENKDINKDIKKNTGKQKWVKKKNKNIENETFSSDTVDFYDYEENIENKTNLIMNKISDAFEDNKKNDDEDDSFNEEKLIEDDIYEDGDSENIKNKEKSVLKKFGVDITDLAKKKKIDIVYGREKEISRILNILGRKKKNNPILIGEAGIGKTAIVEGLAQKIINNNVGYLAGKRIISINVGSLVAGTFWRGQFEERMFKLIEEIRTQRNIIVFFDEIHTILGAGANAGGLDASNILKPALARGEFNCIGATTFDEYKKTIETDSALERRFQKVLIEEPSAEETLKILQKLKPQYEKHHNVIYTNEALEACVKLSIRYISDRNLPDKAIDIFDEAGSTIKNKNINLKNRLNIEKQINKIKQKKYLLVKEFLFEEAINLETEIEKLEKSLEKENIIVEINENDIAEIVSIMTNIPVAKIKIEESKQLLHLQEEIQKEVIGQDHAVSEISKAIVRNRTGIRNINKPIASFFFLGSSGIGKTYLAKILAKNLFASEKSLVRFDMSEYQEEITVSRLIGSPPGYIGYQEGGLLTEAVKKRPYSVLLFDEIEKAHANVYNLFLQILEDGFISDRLGKKVDFKNTIIIFTSNIGVKEINEFTNAIGFTFNSNSEQIEINKEKIIEKNLQRKFPVEFINRIDEFIFFKILSLENIQKIVEIELRNISKQMKELGFHLKFTKQLIENIAKIGYDKKFGARPLKKIIQNKIENKISEMILANKITKDKFLEFSIDENSNEVIIEEKVISLKK